MKRWQKLLLALGVLGLGVYAAYRVVSLDTSAPQDRDLKVEWQDIPNAENALTYFRQASQKVYWPETTAPEEDEEWAESLVSQVLSQNQEALALWHAGMEQPHFQIPRPETPGDFAPQYVFHWITIGRIACLRARSLAQQGKKTQALAQAMKVVRFGHRIEGARGSDAVYLVGAYVKREGLRAIRGVATETPFEREVLEPYIRRLSDYRSNEQGLADAFRVEYTLWDQVIDQIKAGSLPDVLLKPSYSLMTSGDKLNQEFAWTARSLFSGEGKAPSGFWFQPNRTKRMFAETARAHIENVSKCMAKMSGVEPLVKSPDSFSEYLGRALLGNVAGKVLYLTLLPQQIFHRYVVQKCEENVEVCVTRLLLALKCYSMEHANLPETLSELVPHYIDAIPLDDFDGRPLRYSRQKRIVYSVGEDLRDSGGMSKREAAVWWRESHLREYEEGLRPSTWEMPDPSFAIDF